MIDKLSTADVRVHHPECNLNKPTAMSDTKCNCFLSHPTPSMTERQKGIKLREAYDDYRNKHTWNEAREDDAWAHVYRVAASLVRL